MLYKKILNINLKKIEMYSSKRNFLTIIMWFQNCLQPISISAVIKNNTFLTRIARAG